ncbi:hypothetical protein CYLTODRAFT_41857 [Cylindrobasidium torrendii FP15055 ss-10]|uniref:Zn(2)-C6 fungal-type domain-containing protein n=1 Tax=Cylindrobasidium torrendii FP15055 ss-10 TaxID=1314674 RepID=A0A0D7B9J9_9AGAR|nr:hypothetical protein CYLTODRAFT_41857 [Cylindrobasidium torrendii FP15055 ss-10]
MPVFNLNPQFDSHQQSYYPANTATYMPTTTNPVFNGQQWTAGAGPSYESWPEMYTDPATYYPPPSSGPPPQNVALPPQGQIVDAGAAPAFWEEPSQDWMYHQPCYAPSQLSPHSSPPTGTPSPPPASPTNSAGQSRAHRRPISSTEFVRGPYARPVACLPCRKVKMKCESREHGKRCQRCERNNLECVVPEKPKQRVVG